MPAEFSAIADRTQRWVVLALAVGQVVSAAAVFTTSNTLRTNTADATITPPGYAFSIWLIPIVGCLAYSIQNLRANRASGQQYRAIGWPLAGTMAGFSVWLWLAERNWVWATAVVFAVMLAFLCRAIVPLRSMPASVAGWVPYVTIGVYAGWSTVAIWANLAAAIRHSGQVHNATGWQLAILIGATVSSCIGITLSRAQWAYVAATVWAFAAVIVSTADRHAPALAATAAAGLLLTVAATAVVRRSGVR